MRITKWHLWLCVGFCCAGCSQTEFDQSGLAPSLSPNPSITRPEQGKTEVDCRTDGDCDQLNEACNQDYHICEPKRCSPSPAYVASTPPLGTVHYLRRNRTLMAFNQNSLSLDGYKALNNSLEQTQQDQNRWAVDSSSIQYVTGGNFFNQGGEIAAVAMKDQNQVKLVGLPGSSSTANISMGFAPVALAAGDVLGLGREQLIALSSTGNVAVCQVSAQAANPSHCATFQLKFDKDTPVRGATDIALADVDDDGRLEMIFLVQSDEGMQLLVQKVPSSPLSVSSSTATKVEYTPEGTDLQTIIKSVIPIGLKGRAPLKLLSIAAGDLDGDGKPEVVALEGGLLANTPKWLSKFTAPYTGAKLHIYHWEDQKFIEAAPPQTVSSDVVGLKVGNIDTIHIDSPRDKQAYLKDVTKDSVIILHRNSIVETLHSEGSLSQLVSTSSSLSTTPQATHIALIDKDGSSVKGRLTTNPRLVAGGIVPLAVLLIGPYSKSYSQGSASVSFGNSKSQGHDGGDSTVGISAGASVGFNVGPLIAISEQINHDVSHTHSFSESFSIGVNWMIDGQPDTFDNAYAGVIVSSVCFYEYTYQVDAPPSLTHTEGGATTSKGPLSFSVRVPAGAETQPMHSARYNAMAKALNQINYQDPHKGLPIIKVPYHMGDVSSYPNTAQTLEGKPIPPQDMVFPHPPLYRASNLARVSWSLDFSKTESNTEARSLSITNSIMAGFPFWSPINGSADVGVTMSHNDSISLTSSNSFSGWAPQLADDGISGAQQSQTYGYAFSPIVYRAHYSVPETQEDKTTREVDGTYFVVTYEQSK